MLWLTRLEFQLKLFISDIGIRIFSKGNLNFNAKPLTRERG